jgi:hypothetical protein
MMKRTLLSILLAALIWVTAIPALASDTASPSPDPAASPAPVSTAAQFSLADLTLNGLVPGATTDDVKAALGAPLSQTEETTQPATGAKTQDWTYDALTLSFSDGVLCFVDTTSAKYTGPRGLKVGDTEDTVKNAFFVDSAETHYTVLYCSGWIDSLSEPLPPCGTATTWDDGTLYYQYLAPVTPYTADVIAQPESYLFQKHACLTLLLDAKTKTITDLSWFVEALAE